MTAKNALKASNIRKHRNWLIQSVRKHLVPELIKQGFEVASDVQSGLVDREVLVSFPAWGRLIRSRGTTVDLLEIQLAPYGRAAFRINVNVAPVARIQPLTWHVAPDEICVDWRGECFVTHARP